MGSIYRSNLGGNFCVSNPYWIYYKLLFTQIIPVNILLYSADFSLGYHSTQLSSQMFSVKILADSISRANRLTTFELTFPRFILAEVNTHRMLSRNSASSRAIPTEKIIDRLIEEPFIPTFNERAKGMGVGRE